MTRKPKPEPEKQRVVDADSMLLQPFRLHCQNRHPGMRFRTRGEHDADHRLRASSLDHIHSEPEEEGSDTGE